MEPRKLGPRLLGPRLLAPRLLGGTGGREDTPLYASLSGSLPPWMSFVRASDESYRPLDDAEGERLAFAGGNDIPVFHRPFGDAIVGLLIQRAYSNVCFRSNALTAAAWEVESGIPVVTVDQGVAPDGSATADDIEDNEAGAAASRMQRVTLSGLVQFTHSIYARRISGGPAKLVAYQGAGAYDGKDTDIPAAQLAWKRFRQSTVAEGNPVRLTLAPASDSPFPANNALLGKYRWWGAQTEEWKFAHTHVPTEAGAVAHAAGRAVIDPTKLGGRLTGDRGRVEFSMRFFHASTEVPGPAHPVPLALGSAGTSYLDVPDSSQRFRIINNAVLLAQTAPVVWAALDEFRIEFEWGDGVCALRVWHNDAFLEEVGGAWVSPTIDSAWLGSYATTNQIDGIIYNVRIG